MGKHKRSKRRLKAYERKEEMRTAHAALAGKCTEVLERSPLYSSPATLMRLICKKCNVFFYGPDVRVRHYEVEEMPFGFSGWRRREFDA